MKELKEAWEGMEKEGQGKGSLKPARMTRQQAREAEEREAAGGDDAGDEPAEEGAHSISTRAHAIHSSRLHYCQMLPSICEH